MQMQRRAALTRGRAIDRITQNRPAHCRAMHPQLVGASGQRIKRQPSQALVPPHHGKARLRGQTFGINLHPPAARGIAAAQRQVDQAGLLIRTAFDNRPIGFVDLALFEQVAERFERLAVTAQHQTARRIAIEPMRQRRSARQAEFQNPEIGLQRIMFAECGFGAAMHGNAGRFVNHQHQRIAIQQAGEEIFFCHR